MAILSKLEARSPRGKIIYLMIFALLSAGALTMLYPFAIMVSGSLCSPMDEAELNLIPAYLHDDDVLVRKFWERKYNQEVQALNRAHLQQNFSFAKAALPPRVNAKQVADLSAWLGEADMPLHWQVLGGTYGYKTIPQNLRTLRDRLKDRFDDDLAALGRNLGAPVPRWSTITLRPPDWQTQRYGYEHNALYEAYFDMLAESPLAERQLVMLSGYFLETMVFTKYDRFDTADYNAAHTRPLASYGEFVLPRTVPGEDQPALRKAWIAFVRGELNSSYVVLPSEAAEAWRAFLREKYETPDALNRVWAADIASFDDIALPAGEWLQRVHRQDYLQFLLTRPAEEYRLTGPEYAFRDWLAERYGTVNALNDAWGTQLASFDTAAVPIAQLEADYTRANSGSLRWTFATRNFINVFRGMFVQGRALLNTIIFCTLTVLVNLIINPLAAYALSRFRLPGTYKFLLMFMAVMAFPPMVTMIPTFLILREANLLNTFAALILPFAVNGYLIFLLKGFFDSLPTELYEAATLDGAGEIRMFFQITLALSKPILAVVALGAFTASYTMFLYPLVVCPQEDMWLLSVWLYQWQENSSIAGVFASVLVACIPTLLIFILAQRIILRGIVVPIEK